LDNHLFDVSSVILSEGIPASDFGGRAETNSLEIEDNGKPKSNFVSRLNIFGLLYVKVKGVRNQIVLIICAVGMTLTN